MKLHCDVLIAGGGLAGLTLALQLRAQNETISICVIEKESRPLRDACHKVGESSVELGSHYFGKVLGLHDYLMAEHLQKNGLRFLVGPADKKEITERVEIGPPELPVIPAYQMDRGKFENELRDRCDKQNIKLIEGATVRTFDVDGDGPHEVGIKLGDNEHEFTCDFFVDASGRRQLLQSKKQLRMPAPYEASSAWFRIPRLLKFKELVPESEEAWHAEDPDDIRYLSTNHLMGEGYWVWIIPLSTGYTSIGVVALDEIHQPTTYSNEEKIRAWLSEHEPALSRVIENDSFSDFKRINRYSYLSKQVFSEDGWACVGEAALFVDPLYSPGSDFIAMHNAFASELILRKHAGEDISVRAEEYNSLALGIADLSFEIYRHAWRIFPKAHVFSAKLYLDNFIYWSFQCPYYFHDIYKTDLDTLKRFTDIGKEFGDLAKRAQNILGAWADESTAPFNAEVVHLPKVPSLLANLHIALGEERSVDETMTFMQAQLELSKELVSELLIRALKDVGPTRAKTFLQKADVQTLPTFSDKRLSADREGSRRLPKIARDMRRILGAPKGEHALDIVLETLGYQTTVADRPTL